MQIPILNGIYTASNADFRTSYPVNMIPVPKKTGITNGYLQPAWGLIQNGTGSGVGRGGKNWNGTLYRVMGTNLMSIDEDGTSYTIGQTSVKDTVTVGAGPSKCFSDGTYCWVSNYTDGTVSQIEISSDTVLNTIAVGTNPMGLYSDGTYCWVCNKGDGTISRITITTATVTATITVGTSPIDCYSNGTKVWVSNNGSNNISVITIASGTVTDLFSVGSGPWGMNYDGSYLWVVNNGSNTVSKINIVDNSLINISCGNGPKWVSSDGVYVFITNYDSSTVTKIKISTNELASTIVVGTNPTGIYSDGNYIYVVNEADDNLYKIKINTELLVGTLTVGTLPAGLGYDSSYVWVANYTDGTVSKLEIAEAISISGTDLATLDYSPDYLSVSADGKLWLYDGTTFAQITDTDLGTVLDHIWIDGYFMTTDGSYILTTDIDNPFSVTPTNYAASEADSDPIVALLKIRNEAIVLNRFTIEVFDNVGGSGFPFARVETAQIQKGCIGTNACCVFLERIAFLGSGHNEAPAIYLGYNGVAEKISTREIDLLLKDFTEAELSTVLLESVTDENHNLLLVHLPNQTLVFDGAATSDIGQKVWFYLRSTEEETPSQYLARNFIWAYDHWTIEDPSSSRIGYLSDDSASHYSANVRWEFGTIIAYNNGKGAIFNSLELVCLPGRNALSDESIIWSQYSLDGLMWSQPKGKNIGTIGNRKKRLIWFKQGKMRQMRIQRFFGFSDANLAVSTIEAEMEPLNG